VSGEELESFEAMVAPWEQQTGGNMDFTGTRDLIAILTTRVQGANPPDVAILPNPAQMVELARDGELVPLDSFLDMDKIGMEYAQGWIDLGTVDGNLYGIFMKVANKGTVWYNPKTFADNGWEVPTTWDEIIALSDEILDSGLAPWSIGVESGQASGWPGTDWISQIVLREYGGEVYDQWTSHEIPWTDPKIKEAWQRWGTIALTPGYVPGGATAILATNFTDASYLPFEDPPQAAMYYLGSFTQGFIEEQFPALVAEEDYSFFPFPVINPQYSGGVTAGADVVIMFNDNPTTRSFLEYLASAEAQQIWVERGGFTSVNNQVDLDAYPDPLASLAAEQLGEATLFRYGAGDVIPPAVQTAFWQGILAYLQDPNQLDSILANIEAQAVASY
jgi:alpha-glucoside transport system substrate-binding protein